MTETTDTTPASPPASSARGRKDGIEGMLLPQLKQLAGGLGIKTSGMRKGAVIEAIKAHQESQGSAPRARAPQPAAPANEPSTEQAPAAAGSTGGPSTTASSETVEASATSATPAATETSGAPRVRVGRTGSRRARGREEQPAEPSTPADRSGGQSAAKDAERQDEQRDGRKDDQQGGRKDDQQGGKKDGQKDGQKDAPEEDGRQKDAPQKDAQQNGRQRDRQQNDRQQNDRQQNDRGARQEERQDGQQNGRQRDRQQNDRQQNDRQQNDRQQNDRQQNDRARQDRQSDRPNDRQNDRQNDRGDDGQDDDENGSRRNRRRRGRDRQGTVAPAATSRGHRNEPDLQILEDDVLTPCAGILDLMDNYAFVRTSGYLPGVDDVYVSMSMVRRYGLRRGDAVTGQVRQPREGERKEKFNPLVRLDSVNGADPETARSRVEFAKLTPLYPSERLRLETGPTDLIGRVIDIAAPIGKGQRGLIVSPAKAGKTMVLQALARSITTNNPECHLMVVLVDERPEEVTDFERSVKGEVVSSTFDRPAADHTIVAELAIERAMRLVELGHDVVVLLDGITRLGRAYNLAAPASGRILSGSVDSASLYPPKRFFGAARNIENGGSLTIIATALVESGSTMDEVIFEEFKGTGNMEVRLRRDFADQRLFPAIDAVQSGTRREELLMSPDELATVWKLRRVLAGLDGRPALELLLGRLRSSQTNIEFLAQVQKTAPSTLAGSASSSPES